MQLKLIFNFENNIFQDVVVERFHSITPSLLQCNLDSCSGGELPYEKGSDICKKILIQPLKQTNLGAAQASLDL